MLCYHGRVRCPTRTGDGPFVVVSDGVGTGLRIVVLAGIVGAPAVIHSLRICRRVGGTAGAAAVRRRLAGRVAVGGDGGGVAVVAVHIAA